MIKEWFVIYKFNSQGKKMYLKDPEFCIGGQVPFETYQENDPNSPEAFLPWMSLHLLTAEAQASLLETHFNAPHSVGVAKVDFDKLLGS